MQEIIDLKSYSVSKVLNTLLIDRTTGANIIFATNVYEGFGFNTQITTKLLLENKIDLRPRVLKSQEEQTKRTKKKAEVFTPSWVCNKMNNHCDEVWFGRKNVFNVEQERNWVRMSEHITFPEGKTWKDYVLSKRLEITCGEAPYLVSRYDTSTGKIIPIRDRIGILDRKLRVINENTKTQRTWSHWVYKAFESVYGYEYQGDSLLIARINLLETFCEYMKARWGVEPGKKALQRVARIISWNLWQMDGLKGVVPYTMKEEEMGLHEMILFEPTAQYGTSLFEPISTETLSIDCNIYDWESNKCLPYNSMKGE